jgi:predicted RNA binding protein YcfA (HicA-like mRNA interferase family)
MSRLEKLIDRVLRGTSDKNVNFNDLCGLLRHLGFSERIKGSHHIFTRDDVEEILNLQPKGSQAKPYQVKQVRNVILRYELAEEGNSGEDKNDVEAEAEMEQKPDGQ